MSQILDVSRAAEILRNYREAFYAREEKRRKIDGEKAEEEL